MESIVHYYPGHFPPVEVNVRGTGASIGPGLLLVLREKVVLFRGEAWAGPSKPISIPGAPDYTPTPSGTFVLRDPEPYKTSSWRFSEIKWGTKIRPSPQDPMDVWYEQTGASGKIVWASTKKNYKISRWEIEQYYAELYGVRRLPDTWVFNAFGPLAVRFFRDTNNNRRLDTGEELEGAMFHTTAENEAERARSAPLRMTASHGCIHMKPRDRDALIGMKVLKAGTLLVVHSYDEKYGATP